MKPQNNVGDSVVLKLGDGAKHVHILPNKVDNIIQKAYPMMAASICVSYPRMTTIESTVANRGKPMNLGS